MYILILVCNHLLYPQNFIQVNKIWKCVTENPTTQSRSSYATNKKGLKIESLTSALNSAMDLSVS